MSRCPVYNAIRKHRPELLGDCAQIIANDSLSMLEKFLIKHGWLTRESKILIRYHALLVKHYETFQNIPKEKKRSVRKRIQPLINTAVTKTVALVIKDE
jgi:hypothetical protein